MRNFIAQRHGGGANRPGSEFVAEVKDSTKTVRLLKFVFNSSQTYILEFGNLYMRVIQDAAQVTDLTLTITAISNANPGVVTYTGTDPVNGQEVYISGIVGPIGNYLNNRNFKIANVNGGANTFELQTLAGVNFNTTSLGAYTSAGTAKRILTVTTTYAEADLSTLKFVQSADVITIVHPTYPVREVARVSATSWTITDVTFAPGQAAPTGQSATQNGATGATTYNYKITAVASETYEESLPTAAATVSNGNATISATNNISVSWTAASGAVEYNVYRSVNGVYGFIGIASASSFVDTGFTPDTVDTPPITRNPFGSSDNYPSAVGYIQQRLGFADTNNDPEKVFLSKTGFYKNFTISSPIQDDDAVTFTMAGRQVNAVKHLVDLGELIVFTTGGEWNVGGDQSGIIRPTDINPKQHSYSGSGDLAPIVIDGTALYVQARGNLVRDLGFDYQIDGYRGNDLSIFSSHLFEGYTLVDWDYQQIPNSVVWAVRSDGTLLGLTYLREQQVLAWHRHDTDGTIENVCSIPEGSEDALYMVVKRTINGSTKRYIERFSTRFIDDVVDATFMDSYLSYDGRNTTSTTMTLSGSGWTYTDTLTLTASASFFTAADVGNQIHLTGSDGTLIRFTINAYSSATVVTGKPNKTVPVVMRATAMLVWTRAVDQLTGLWHLEGETISVFADGFVVANPNNEAYDTLTITNGTITLDKPYGVIHVGMPYISDLETLNINAQGETMVDKKMRVGYVTMQVEKSRGIWVGATPPEDDDEDPLDGLFELKIRASENYDEPVSLQTDAVQVIIRPEWNSNGRVFIRQVDPVPVTILSIAPNGNFPIRQGGA